MRLLINAISIKAGGERVRRVGRILIVGKSMILTFRK